MSKLNEYQDLEHHFSIHKLADEIILDSANINIDKAITISGRTEQIRAAEQKITKTKTITRHEPRLDTDGKVLREKNGVPLYDVVRLTMVLGNC